MIIYHLHRGVPIAPIVAKIEAAKGPVELVVDGEVDIDQPLVFNGVRNLTVKGARGLLSGGITIEPSEWAKTEFHGRPAYVADWQSGLPLAQRSAPHEAWSSGVRFQRPSLLETGFWSFAGFVGDNQSAAWNVGQSAMRFAPNTLANWSNLTDVELVVHQLWVTSRLPIASIDGDTVQFSKKSVFKLGADDSVPFRAENVAEALDKPNEFYFDRTAGRVYVSASTWPGKPGSLTLPIAQQLLIAKNCAGLKIEDLSFSYCEWCYPGPESGDPQAATSVPAAVEVDNSDKPTIGDCRFEHLGTYGAAIRAGCADAVISRSKFEDLGAGGVKIETGSFHTFVDNCVIEHGGRLHQPAVGVWIQDSGYNVVQNNLIDDFYYTGISIGWVWGYGPSHGDHNFIEGNAIFDIGQGELSDMGGIYNLGVSTGTHISRNLIVGVQARTYGGWGVYLDEGSSGVVVEQNAVFDTKTGSFHQHYGQSNLLTHNLFCGAKEGGQIIRTRQEDHQSFDLKQNVILWDSGGLFGGNFGGGGIKSEDNLLGQATELPAFDQGSRVIAPGDDGKIRWWFGIWPGSPEWWDQFGPVGDTAWRAKVAPRVNAWLRRLPRPH